MGREEIDHLGETASSHHPIVEFMAEVPQSQTTFLDNTVYKGERLKKEPVLDLHTHYKPTETLQYNYCNSCHLTGVEKGFVKGEALGPLRTNSSRVAFDGTITEVKAGLVRRAHPQNMVDNGPFTLILQIERLP